VCSKSKTKVQINSKSIQKSICNEDSKNLKSSLRLSASIRLARLRWINKILISLRSPISTLPRGLCHVTFFETPEKKPKTRFSKPKTPFSKPKTRFFKPKTFKSKPKTFKSKPKTSLIIKKNSLHPYRRSQRRSSVQTSRRGPSFQPP